MTIEELSPYFAFIVAVITIAGALIGIGIWISDINKKIDLGSWQGEVNTDRNNFKEFMVDMKRGMRKIEKRLGKLSDDILVIKTSKTIQESNSPITLNKFGQKISEEIGAKEFAEREARELLKCDIIIPENVYDIQRFCLDYIQIDFEPDEEYLSKMKEVSYNNGLPLSETKDVLAIELRDVLLKLKKSES